MPSPPHPRLRNRHSLPRAVSNGAHPSDYAVRGLWIATPCDLLEHRHVVPTSESPTTQPVTPNLLNFRAVRARATALREEIVLQLTPRRMRVRLENPQALLS